MFRSAERREFANFCSVQQAGHQIMGLDYSLFSNFIFMFFNYIIIIYRIVSNRLIAAADLIVISVKFILLSSM